MIKEAAEGALQVPLMLLFPFLLAVGTKSPGLHKEKINIENNSSLHYELYMPEKKKEESLPVIVLLEANGGDFKLLEKNKELTALAEENQIIMVNPYKKGPWLAEDSIKIKKLVYEITKLIKVNDAKIYFITNKDANLISGKLLCEGFDGFKEVIMFSHNNLIMDKNCNPNPLTNISIEKSSLNKTFWESKLPKLQSIEDKYTNEKLENGKRNKVLKAIIDVLMNS